jgi:mono/diheme cytochrome c family protein
MKKTIVLLCAGITSGMMLLSSCSKDPKNPGLEYMPDMYRSPSYEVYSPNPLFKDSMSMRLPVAGTVPRDYAFFTYPNTPEGYQAASIDVKNPLVNTPENLAEGKRLFDIFCINCHGATGQGDGSIVALGKFPPPPSYSGGNSSRGGLMKDLTDGKIFHTITYGVNLMGSHASQLNPTERWKVVMYVHQLQAGGAATAPAAANTTTVKDSTEAPAKAK